MVQCRSPARRCIVEVSIKFGVAAHLQRVTILPFRLEMVVGHALCTVCSSYRCGTLVLFAGCRPSNSGGENIITVCVALLSHSPRSVFAVRLVCDADPGLRDLTLFSIRPRHPGLSSQRRSRKASHCSHWSCVCQLYAPDSAECTLLGGADFVAPTKEQ